MKTISSTVALTVVWLSVGTLHAATVATPITPYHSLADSPWYQAVAGGDALAYYSHTWDDCDPTGIGTLPDGLGVYDDYQACASPWVTRVGAEFSSSSGVDADDGLIDGVAHGNSLRSNNTIVNGFTLTFIPTSTGKLPQWFGFVSMTRRSSNFPAIEILGIGGGVLDTIVLTDLTLAVNSNPPGPNGSRFQGFVIGQEITAIRFLNGGTIDHFQYGYGAAPIPESSAIWLASVGVGGLGLRRRRGKADGSLPRHRHRTSPQRRAQRNER